MLYVIIEAGEVMHGLKESIGDVRPENVFLSNKGEIKILAQVSLP